jgi:hypothetical protein
MWVVDNQTPFAAERCWIRDRDGSEVWLVAVRAAFSIAPDGATQPAKEQEPVVMAPEYWGEPAATSLRYDSDLVHKKLSTDVLLHGHAYAPKGKPAEQVDVSLETEGVKKQLSVIGDRVWERSLGGVKLSAPTPFVQMPIRYERAFGGRDESSSNPKEWTWDVHNPVGRGFAAKRDNLAGKPAPNIEGPAADVAAGFGPVPGHWLPRASFAGTYDAQWERDRLPLLPDDFDDRFYQSAPPDQQTPRFLQGGELVELRNLTPNGYFRFHLPRVTLRFRTRFSKGPDREHRGQLHTVIIEPDVPRVVMVWHTHLSCHHQVLRLLGTVVKVLPRINPSARMRAAGIWTGVRAT